MDNTITENDLHKLGIDLIGNELTSLLDHLNEELNDRVGESILRELSDDQIDEYNEIMKTDDDNIIGGWILKQIPDFQQIVQDEINVVLGEVAEKSTEIKKS